MDRSSLDDILCRLSLDAVPSRVCGIDCFPILGIEGSVLYARARTVLVANGFGKFAQRPGVEYAVVGKDGEPLDEFGGQKLHGGRSQSTVDRFIENFGQMFQRSDIEIVVPEDRFKGMLPA